MRVTVPSINAAGLALIKSFEGCELHEYVDAVGVPTIGYGHTGPDVHPGETETQAQADATLQHDLAEFEQGVNGCVSRNLTSNQFSALVSFAYNVGLGSLTDSTLLRKVNAGDFAGAADEFGKWVHGNGNQVLPGLVRRRAAERALFLQA